MAAPSVTYTFINGQTSDGPQVSQNFTDLINALSDGSKDLTVASLSAATLTGTTQYLAATGSASTPSFGFASFTTTGMYAAAGPLIQWSISGTNVMRLSSTTLTLLGGATILSGVATIINSGTLTLPTSTDTLVGRATTDTLTNKTLTAPVIATISNSGTLTLPTGTDTLVGRATTDTLTNKTISAAAFSGTQTGATTWSGAMTISNGTGVTSPFAIYRYANAGDGTGALRFTMGNSGSNQGIGRIEYTNAAATGAPTFFIFHSPRNNGDTTIIDAVAIKMYKTAGSDGGEMELQTATTAGTLTNAITISNTQAVRFPTITTTASAANAFLDSGSSNNLLRSTSSLRYKEEINDLEVDSSRVYDLKPISFTDKKFKTRHFGLAAEQVAEVLPEMVQFAPETVFDANGNPDKKVPDGVQYQLLSILLLEEVKKLKAKVEAIQNG